MVTFISSLQNDFVLATVRLHSAKGRRDEQAFLVEGVRACTPYFAAHWEPYVVWVTEAVLPWAQEQGVPDEVLRLVSDAVMAKLSLAESPSGIVAVFKQPSLDLPPVLQPGIVLADMRDPGNVGTLIRTAQAFASAIYLVDGVDVFNPKVVQASAGALAQKNVFCSSWEALFEQARASSMRLCALVSSGGTPVSELEPDARRLLVVGNEAHGLPQVWCDACDERVTIPMPGGTESLNAAVAGAIALYEVSQKRLL